MKNFKIVITDNQHEIYFSAFLPQAVKITRYVRQTDACKLYRQNDKEEWECITK